MEFLVLLLFPVTKKVGDGMTSTIFVLGQSDKKVGNEKTFVICVTFEMDYKGESWNKR